MVSLIYCMIYCLPHKELWIGWVWLFVFLTFYSSIHGPLDRVEPISQHDSRSRAAGRHGRVRAVRTATAWICRAAPVLGSPSSTETIFYSKYAEPVIARFSRSISILFGIPWSTSALTPFATSSPTPTATATLPSYYQTATRTGARTGTRARTTASSSSYSAAGAPASGSVPS